MNEDHGVDRNRQTERQTLMIAWANHVPVEFQQKRLKEKKKEI